jgi:hypothetical protein
MILLASMLLSLSLPLGRAHADPDAIIRNLAGPVTVRPNGEKKYIDAEAGFPLTYRDQIKTGSKGMAQVEFPNGTVILVKENSFFMIGGTPKNTWVSFQIGEFLIGIKRSLEPKESFVVRTPAALATVRGTLFLGMSDSKKNSIWTGFGHKVVVTAQNKTVIVGPGQTVKVNFGSPPEEIQASNVSKSYLQTFSIENNILDLDKLVDPSIQ